MIRYQQSPDTFHVHEELFYAPSGEGDYVFAEIEKRGISTRAAKHRLAEMTSVPIESIRHAGMKDTAATARQWLSWHADLQKAEPIGSEDVDIVQITRHTNNLSVGHVRGNRFLLKLQVTSSANLPEAYDIHFANFYGPQRFGRGRPDREQIVQRLRRPSKRRESLSVIQSALFNDWLRERLERHGQAALPDDLWTATNGKTHFKPEPDDNEIPARFARGEISPTGPMFGFKVKLTEPEQAWLKDELELEPPAFRAWGKIARGARRALFIKPENAVATPSGETLDLSFGLPSGAYATVYLTALFMPEVLSRDLSEWPDFTEEVTMEPGP